MNVEPGFNPKKLVAIDTETTGLNVWHGDIAFSVSLCDEEGNTAYCEWLVDPYTRKCEPNKEDLEFIQSYFGNDKYETVYHNAKFDVRMLEAHGLTLKGIVHDTHVAARVANNVEFGYGLKDLAWRHLKIPATDEQDLKDEVKRCRRLAQQLNRAAEKAGEPLILLGEVSEMDYWIPRWENPDNDICEKYCRMDTVRTMALHLFYQTIFEKDPYLQDGYETEMKLWYQINRMERRGMRIDRKQVEAELYKARSTMTYHRNELIRMIKDQDLRPFEDDTSVDTFNPGSTKQLRRVLYLPRESGGLGLTTKRTTDKGDYSTDKNALRELTFEPFIRELVGFRASDQVIGLFFEKYLDIMIDDDISPQEKVIRPGLNQVGTVTFRFSSSNPNMQQVGNPKTAHNAVSTYHPRAPFGPRKDYYWYGADYCQQELRLFAAISENPFLLEQIFSGADPNTACANKAWGGKNNPQALKAAALALDLGRETPTSDLVATLWEEIGWNSTASKEFGAASTRSHLVAEEWLKQYDYDIVAAEKSVGRSNSRGRAKCVVFAKIYGGGPSSVTELLYCPLHEAKAFMDDYDRAMPEINQYMSEMIRQARKDGFIINPYGRKVRIEQDFAYRAVNYMIQSTAACQMKDSIIRCGEYLRETGKDAHVIMTIHDELLFEIRQAHAFKWLIRGIIDIMEDNQGRISVPTPVDMNRIRESWGTKEPIEV